jgi:hypothetical protein
MNETSASILLKGKNYILAFGKWVIFINNHAGISSPEDSQRPDPF